MKRCLTVFVIREPQIIWRHHYKPIKLAKTRGIDTTKSWQGHGATGLSFIVPGQVQTLKLPWKRVWTFLVKVHMLLLCELTTWAMLIGLSPNEVKAFLHTKIFVTALFTVARMWKQSACPSVSEWTNCDSCRQGNIFSWWNRMSCGVKLKKPIWKAACREGLRGTREMLSSSWAQGCTPGIPATQEAGGGWFWFQDQPEAI
jgi:hypothetical protein